MFSIGCLLTCESIVKTVLVYSLNTDYNCLFIKLSIIYTYM